ncbi:MAG: O-antigen ligase family protein [Winogradskyella sp.]|nr:O-antigen ligase family protein [Winogradskyella sp.]
MVMIHVALGFLVYFIPFSSKLYFICTTFYFLYQIINASTANKAKNVVFACCYVVGSEVFFRMTSGNISYEAAKYLIMVYVLIGLFSNGISNKSYSYLFYLFLLIPSIIVAYLNIGLESNFRTNVAFVLSGPVCLGISALYLYNRRIKLNDLIESLKYLSLPIISMTVYLFLYNPSIKDVLSGTQSNFETSGGFGPNQVATVLGLGMFALSVRLFMKSPSLFLRIFNVVILGVISFRAIVTFSRGGVITAILIILLFLFSLYKKSSLQYKGRIIYTSFIFILLAGVVWIISSNQTEGLIEKRYANQDKIGREKEDLSTGRVELFLDDLQGFKENPFLGVGANGAKELRLKAGQGIKASHNEISRLLSEHGMFAIIILIILIIQPLSLRFSNKRNLYFYAFLGFWFATINHSAMRIAAPAFIYALALLNVQYEKRPVRRKRAIQ